MSRTVRETLAEAYDPDPRAMAIVAMGSSFLLVSLLSNPDVSNPSYLFGLVAAVLSLVVSVAVLAVETRR
ncbi:MULTISPECIES: hypothetical protein [unclassified Haloferax]|uniref:hypothetical protein n=1 Tax=unclassified Haloferax TaxID=2625095 RepID=UPI0002B09549|nr:MULTISPECIES: hypothetical protein [unclassified Haloferax]ELZ57969.1 hypothetical protein C460_11743 [Haloferax sp. ATCC BAA-646]ELZ62454.1 hypothetical protein C459_13124 [Haloferax sp. ATCC BAA-645]ELZ64059.1 hypothetical protein C458_14562 [Haloferax sp. ATCC BAA-644]